MAYNPSKTVLSAKTMVEHVGTLHSFIWMIFSLGCVCSQHDSEVTTSCRVQGRAADKDCITRMAGILLVISPPPGSLSAQPGNEGDKCHVGWLVDHRLRLEIHLDGNESARRRRCSGKGKSHVLCSSLVWLIWSGRKQLYILCIHLKKRKERSFINWNEHRETKNARIGTKTVLRVKKSVFYHLHECSCEWHSWTRQNGWSSDSTHILISEGSEELPNHSCKCWNSGDGFHNKRHFKDGTPRPFWTYSEKWKAKTFYTAFKFIPMYIDFHRDWPLLRAPQIYVVKTSPYIKSIT